MTRAAQLAGLGSLEGSAPAYACRAWVNFNGQGTIAIRASGNVSSLTDNGTGNYTVNFTNSMPDTNYCVNTENGDMSNVTYIGPVSYAIYPRVGSVNVNVVFTNSTYFDPNYVGVSIFR